MHRRRPIRGGLRKVYLPPEQGNLLLWLDTTDPTTVFSDNPPTIQAVNNDPIEYIVNKGTDGSSLDMDFWPDTPNFAILQTNVINGLQILGLDDERFDNSILSVCAGAGPTNNPNGATIAAVLRIQVFTSNLHGPTPGAANDFIITAGTTWTTECGNSGSKDTGKAQVAGEWVWAYQTATSAGDSTWRASGVGESSDSGNPFSADGLTNNLAYFLNQGQIAECLYWDLALGTTARADLIEYFDDKYGVLPF